MRARAGQFAQQGGFDATDQIIEREQRLHFACSTGSRSMCSTCSSICSTRSIGSLMQRGRSAAFGMSHANGRRVGVRRYEDLVCWQLSDELKRRVYAVIARPEVRRDFDFCDQVRRSARSAPSNIAEDLVATV